MHPGFKSVVQFENLCCFCNLQVNHNMCTYFTMYSFNLMGESILLLLHNSPCRRGRESPGVLPPAEPGEGQDDTGLDSGQQEQGYRLPGTGCPPSNLGICSSVTSPIGHKKSHPTFPFLPSQRPDSPSSSCKTRGFLTYTFHSPYFTTLPPGIGEAGGFLLVDPAPGIAGI